MLNVLDELCVGPVIKGWVTSINTGLFLTHGLTDPMLGIHTHGKTLDWLHPSYFYRQLVTIILLCHRQL